MKTIKQRNSNNKWITYALKEEKTNLVQLSKQFRQSKDKDTNTTLKRKLMDYRKNINETKKAYYNDKILKSENIVKTVWGINNSVVGNKNCQKHYDNFKIKVGNKTLTDPTDIGNSFNDYFLNMVDLSSQHSLQHVCLDETFNKFSNDNLRKPTFRFKPVTARDVNNILSLLKNNYSGRIDEIPVILLKSAREHLCEILAHLVNSSFIYGIFPDQLKIAKIFPIHKKDDKKEMSNYLPVSLLPST
uniref:Reverse transcriptase domain-containing protein n=1 Tax=Homalodisca liturata TaxID=320908 RepID=A0A1B6H8Z4_9HEMI